MGTTRPSLTKLIVLKLLGAAVPVVTIGLAGWLLTGLVAIKRRSIALGLSAAGYLAVTVWFIAYVVAPDGPEISDGQALASLLYLTAAVGCAIQAAIVIGSPTHRGPFQPPYPLPPQSPYLQPGPPQPQYNHQLSPYQAPPPGYGPPATSYSPAPALAPDAVLRNQARLIAAHQPALARSLGIGRPDLPRQYDDGGLIDLNDAPADLLDILPGITGKQAAAIVVSRTQQGRFHLVDDLWTRGLLPAHLAPQLADRLVIIDVQDSAGGTG